MCWDENSLKDVWISLFQSDVCVNIKSNVFLKDFNKEIVGSLMLIERTVLAFKELGKNYANSLEDVKIFKTELANSAVELKALREQLNETQKPCENCLTLEKELSLAKKRAKDAECRVSQIAKILVVQSDNVELPSHSNKSPTKCSSKSPKRKRNCIRDNDDNLVDSYSSQAVETGNTGSQSSPKAKKDNDVGSDNLINKPQQSSISPKQSKSTGIVARLSRSIDFSFPNERLISPRRNLSDEFDLSSKISSPRKNRMVESDLKKSNKQKDEESTSVVKPIGGLNDSFTAFANTCGKELDELWFNDNPANYKKKEKDKKKTDAYLEKINDDNNDAQPGPSCSTSNRTKEIEIWNTKSVKSNRNLRSNNMRLNPDSSYSIVFEKKKPKKKFKQLTLQMKPASTANEDSDPEDIVMPSPDKLLLDNQNNDEEDDLESCFAPPATSTQIPVNYSSNFVLDKRKIQGSPKQKATSSSASRNLDSSFDVVLDKRKTTPSPNYKYKGKTVRGKARAKLQGWDCEECKKFYELACKNQSPSKVKAKMNYCSRHRSKYKQARPPTPPGFWDIDIPDSPE